MNFDPFTEEELIKEDTLSPGLYEFQIKEAFEILSKAGNPMFKIVLNVENSDGLGCDIHDYLVLTTQCRWKLKQFAKSCGLEDKLKEGIINEEDLIGKKGECETKIEKTDNGDFLKIKKYIINSNDSTNINHILDDDIPF